ncbi:hypothetical protein K504DRAFT_495464 [Pleomassaria siparia CBS 279.74]|uniref:Uncharacterized protein n=1 Tax=Pleomassaria siparia CBS 279.74 TaxID=1314801 RepID=A0A6G1JTW3_9PLEO|nr:hypothetical protein K504DRAFT_495464 [Pleomassaria siparia CBS 279.74]
MADETPAPAPGTTLLPMQSDSMTKMLSPSPAHASAAEIRAAWRIRNNKPLLPKSSPPLKALPALTSTSRKDALPPPPQGRTKTPAVNKKKSTVSRKTSEVSNKALAGNNKASAASNGQLALDTSCDSPHPLAQLMFNVGNLGKTKSTPPVRPSVPTQRLTQALISIPSAVPQARSTAPQDPKPPARVPSEEPPKPSSMVVLSTILGSTRPSVQAQESAPLKAALTSKGVIPVPSQAQPISSTAYIAGRYAEVLGGLENPFVQFLKRTHNIPPTNTTGIITNNGAYLFGAGSSTDDFQVQPPAQAQGNEQLHFGDDWEQGIRYRYRTIRAPELLVSEDKTLTDVLQRAEHWVKLLYLAMTNMEDINDNPNSRDVKIFSSSSLDKKAVEATCRLVFTSLIHRCIVGFCGSDIRNVSHRVDQRLTCMNRLLAVISALHNDKKVCRDVLLEDSKIAQFVHQPVSYLKAKIGQELNNRRKAKRYTSKAGESDSNVTSAQFSRSRMSEREPLVVAHSTYLATPTLPSPSVTPSTKRHFSSIPVKMLLGPDIPTLAKSAKKSLGNPWSAIPMSPTTQEMPAQSDLTAPQSSMLCGISPETSKSTNEANSATKQEEFSVSPAVPNPPPMQKRKRSFNAPDEGHRPSRSLVVKFRKTSDTSAPTASSEAHGGSESDDSILGHIPRSADTSKATIIPSPKVTSTSAAMEDAPILDEDHN